jgi:hypothetical protein
MKQLYTGTQIIGENYTKIIYYFSIIIAGSPLSNILKIYTIFQSIFMLGKLHTSMHPVLPRQRGESQWTHKHLLFIWSKQPHGHSVRLEKETRANIQICLSLINWNPLARCQWENFNWIMHASPSSYCQLQINRESSLSGLTTMDHSDQQIASKTFLRK